MPNAILTTKLFAPPLRSDLVPRERLLAQLDEGLRVAGGFGRALTLLSAPAGFGKTTLLAGWLASCDCHAAWLSLDEGDGDPTRFMAYLAAALRTVAPDLGEDALGMLESPQPPSVDAILTALLNEIAGREQDVILVLDDYHAVDSQAVDGALSFLLENIPAQMHLVIATREDPQLPLPRLRARGRMTELRAADLRFTPDEAAEFLNRVMGLALSPGQVAALDRRTEGWIAGLQLAALSMRGREDAAAFITAFAGDNRYIVDYLAEEVLQRQPESLRDFLLQTSILERLSGPLCEAVSGQTGGGALLEALERGNLFVVPLDDNRRWYRYHHLFADALQARLLEAQPDLAPELHCRASAWYEQNGMRAEAIRHALAAQDFNRAAGLIELAWAEMDRRRQSARWLRWAQALPDEVLKAHPVLSAGYAWALLDAGALEKARSRLADAERWLQPGAGRPLPDKMVVTDEEEYRYLAATIFSGRAYYALATGDVPGTIRAAQQALDLTPEDAYLRRGTPESLLAIAAWTSGDLPTAEQAFSEAMEAFRKAGNILFAVTGTYVLATIKLALGRLRQAFDLFRESMQLAAAEGKTVLWGTADLHTGLGELLCEVNDLVSAEEALARARQIGERSGLPRWYFRWCIAKARLEEAQRKPGEALELLEEAQRHYVRGPVPEARPIAAMKARLAIRQGRLEEAFDWARRQGLSSHDGLSYLREFEHITLARALLARCQLGKDSSCIEETLELLERLRDAAEAGGRRGSALEILILQALAHQAGGNLSSAREIIGRALRLAQPEGYVRVFIDEGEPLKLMIEDFQLEIGKQPGEHKQMIFNYTEKLLASFDRSTIKLQPATGKLKSKMIEPLSERELEVLRLLAEGLSNREIGERLYIALPTVKGHNRNIYAKLGANRRTEAIARARELGLL